MDVKSFMELLIDNLAGIVQYNGLQNTDIFDVCDILNNEDIGVPLERLAAVNTLNLESVGQVTLHITMACPGWCGVHGPHLRGVPVSDPGRRLVRNWL